MPRIFVTAVFLTTLLFIGCTSNPTTIDKESPERETTARAGKDAAAHDLTAGKLVLRIQNLPSPPGYNEYTKLLEVRCGFTFKIITGKLTNADAAYNEAMEAEAKRKFGNDIFNLLKAEAKTKFEQGL